MTQSELQNAYSQYLKHQSYMKAYNQRPEVKEKRTQYNKRKWAMMKQAAQLVKEEQV